jgi:unsaturated rhamnogalacturonyl hydrolase
VKLLTKLAAALAAFQFAAAGGLAQTYRTQWLAVADRLVSTDATKIEFNWGEGVQMSGLMQAWGRTREPRYAAFVERWAGFHLPSGLEKLLGNHAASKRKGYCGYWVCGTALAYLHEASARPEHLQTASEIAKFISAGATRSPEGAPGHWSGNFQIWVDTLNMSCPLLSRLAVAEKRPAYLDDAVNQLLVSTRHMRNEKSGLFHHMWDWQHDRRSPVEWGRGNGWVIMSIADTFEFLPRSHPRFAELKKLTLSYAKSLETAQDKDGVWHTVMTDPQSPAECSATTMIAYGLLKLVRLGVLPAKHREPARRAWKAVNERWVKDGIVTGVSGGTGPGDAASYIKRPMGTFPWGTGSYLMAGAEMDRLDGRR